MKTSASFIIIIFFSCFWLCISVTIFPMKTTLDPEVDREMDKVKEELMMMKKKGHEEAKVLMSWLAEERIKKKREMARLKEQEELEVDQLQTKIQQIDLRILERNVEVVEVKAQLQKAQDTIKRNKETISDLKRQTEEIAVPLSIHNKVIEIEKRHPEVEPMIPDEGDEFTSEQQQFQTSLTQRKLVWMKLLNCSDDADIQKLNLGLLEAYSKTNDSGLTYEDFKMEFCYALTDVVDYVGRRLQGLDYEPLEGDFILISKNNPLFRQYVVIFYNSVIARPETSPETPITITKANINI